MKCPAILSPTFIGAQTGWVAGLAVTKELNPWGFSRMGLGGPKLCDSARRGAISPGRSMNSEMLETSGSTATRRDPVPEWNREKLLFRQERYNHWPGATNNLTIHMLISLLPWIY